MVLERLLQADGCSSAWGECWLISGEAQGHLHAITFNNLHYLWWRVRCILMLDDPIRGFDIHR